MEVINIETDFTYFPIVDETGTYRQKIDVSKFEALLKDVRVSNLSVTPNRELSHAYTEEHEEHGDALLAFNCSATLTLSEAKEEVSCQLDRIVRRDIEDDDSTLDLDYELEAEAADIMDKEIDVDHLWPGDNIGRWYKIEILRSSQLAKRAFVGEPELVRPTWKYFADLNASKRCVAGRTM